MAVVIARYHLCLLTLALAAASGCVNEGGRSPSSLAPDYAVKINAVLASGFADSTTCGERRPALGGQLVVVLTAEKCLSCESAGFTLRTLQRIAERRAGSLLVVFPAADSVGVCQFLRQERLPNVVGIAVPGVPWPAGPTTEGFLRFWYDTAGPSNPRFVQRAMSLLDDTVSVDAGPN